VDNLFQNLSACVYFLHHSGPDDKLFEGNGALSQRLSPASVVIEALPLLAGVLPGDEYF
jgi:hypothetical protein